MSETAATSTGGPTQTGNGAAMGITAAGALSSIVAQNRAGVLNSRAAEFNADYERTRANQAVNAGEYSANVRAGQERKTEGAINAAAAGQGVVAGSGSAGHALATSEAASAADQMAIRTNAMRQAYGFEVSASEQDQRARLATTGMRTGIAATLLNTANQEELESDEKYGGFRQGGVKF